jgi:RecJ-like exonuclease
LIKKHQEIKMLAQQKLDGVRQNKLDASYFRQRTQNEQTPLISGIISYARQTSTPARYKISVEAGYVLVEISDSASVDSYLNRKVDVWGEVKQKSGYTYIRAGKLRLAE